LSKNREVADVDSENFIKPEILEAYGKLRGSFFKIEQDSFAS